MKLINIILLIGLVSIQALATKPKLKAIIPQAEIILFEELKNKTDKLNALKISYNKDFTFSYFKCVGTQDKSTKKIMLNCPKTIGPQRKYSVQQINLLAKKYIKGDSEKTFIDLADEGVKLLTLQKASQKAFEELASQGVTEIPDLIKIFLKSLDVEQQEQGESINKNMNDIHPFAKAAFLPIIEWADKNLEPGAPIFKYLNGIQSIGPRHVELSLTQLDIAKTIDLLNNKLSTLK